MTKKERKAEEDMKKAGRESAKVGLRMDDALCRSMWNDGVNKIAAGLRLIWPNSLVELCQHYRYIVNAS